MKSLKPPRLCPASGLCSQSVKRGIKCPPFSWLIMERTAAFVCYNHHLIDMQHRISIEFGAADALKLLDDGPIDGQYIFSR